MTQPPAYDIKDGLRIWKNGKHVTTIPEHYFANLAMRLIDEMRKQLDDK